MKEELEQKTGINSSLDFDTWHWEEDKDILLICPDEIRWAKKRTIFLEYLKKIKVNVYSSEVEEAKKEMLRSFFKIALERANVLTEAKGKKLEEVSEKMTLDSKKYLNADDEGNLYVSDDI